MHNNVWLLESAKHFYPFGHKTPNASMRVMNSSLLTRAAVRKPFPVWLDQERQYPGVCV